MLFHASVTQLGIYHLALGQWEGSGIHRNLAESFKQEWI